MDGHLGCFLSSAITNHASVISFMLPLSHIVITVFWEEIPRCIESVSKG